MYFLTSRQSGELDEISSKRFNISGRTLMGNAGNKIAEILKKNYPDIHTYKILIVCGKGNNGGDGFATGVELKEFYPTINSIFPADKLTTDSQYYYKNCEALSIPIHSWFHPPKMGEKFDLIIDALLGVGIKGVVRSPIKEWIIWMNEQNAKIISVDIPSGLNSDTGAVEGVAVKASETITMGFKKTGIQFQLGPEYCGKVTVADIGFPILKTPLSGIRWEHYNSNEPVNLLIPPPKDSYKHKRGNVLVIAGSKGMTGASMLCGMGALNSGAGLIKICIPESLNISIESNFIEGMSVPCADEGRGFLTETNFNQIRLEIDKCDVVVLGPGLGRNKSTIKLINLILNYKTKPMIVDADALQSIENTPALISNSSQLVLTPHLSEFSRLTSVSISTLISDFISVIEDFMSQFKGILVLKTVPVCVVKNRVGSINISGNQGLATAGTGDVLAGCIGGLISQGIPLFEAAKLGVFVHGKSADFILDQTGFRGMTAMRVLEGIPGVIKSYEFK